MFAFLIYHSIPLGIIMTSTIMLNLLLTTVISITIPLLIQKLERDPAIGSSIMITTITDSNKFFIFLGLATLFLI